jgi:hypothetical protein
MKRIDLSRDVKKELWRLFDSGVSCANATIHGAKPDPLAVDKQFSLWQEYRSRHPKRK